ncbi:hypothetical protein HAX54_004668, partial [Datura stramonium]|nr:hypothetical protein [Datura stramonium]
AHRPYTLHQAYHLSRNTESQLQAQMKLTRGVSHSEGHSHSKGCLNGAQTKAPMIRREGNQFRSEALVNFNKDRRLRVIHVSKTEAIELVEGCCSGLLQDVGGFQGYLWIYIQDPYEAMLKS